MSGDSDQRQRLLDKLKPQKEAPKTFKPNVAKARHKPDESEPGTSEQSGQSGKQRRKGHGDKDKDSRQRKGRRERAEVIRAEGGISLMAAKVRRDMSAVSQTSASNRGRPEITMLPSKMEIDDDTDDPIGRGRGNIVKKMVIDSDDDDDDDDNLVKNDEKSKLTVSKTETHESDEDSDDAMVRELLRDDFISEHVASRLVEDYDLPVVLDADHLIETDPDRTKFVEMRNETVGADTGSVQDVMERAARGDSMVFLMQLPGQLPSRPSGTRTGGVTPVEGVAHLEEGPVGKLQLLDSGQVRLLLNGVPFQVDLGQDQTLEQELVAIRTNETDRTGQSISLGNVKRKLICSLDYQHIS